MEWSNRDPIRADRNMGRSGFPHWP